MKAGIDTGWFGTGRRIVNGGAVIVGVLDGHSNVMVVVLKDVFAPLETIKNVIFVTPMVGGSVIIGL